MSNAFGQPQETAKPRWEIDRKVPLALIVVLATQLAGGVWWIKGTENRIANLEAGNIRTEAILKERIALNDDRFAKFIRVDTKVEFVAEAVKRIEQALEKR